MSDAVQTAGKSAALPGNEVPVKKCGVQTNGPASAEPPSELAPASRCDTPSPLDPDPLPLPVPVPEPVPGPGLEQ